MRADSRLICFVAICALVATVIPGSGQSSSSSNSKHRRAVTASDSALEPGTISNNTYRNNSLGITCQVPLGWVLRTDDMNAHDDDSDPNATPPSSFDPKPGRVLLAVFSRPPEARGENVNASIVIAAESASAYPGLKEAAQYLGPIAEVAKGQGFTVAHEPYEIAIGAKPLAREDFQKDVGSRVMRQSTLVVLAKGYAVSLTFIAGTPDEVDELIGALTFAASAQAGRP
jgi:hypothetical protein